MPISAMACDPLEALLRLRRLAVDEARRGVAACVDAEAEAARTVARLKEAIERETEVASSLTTDDADVEAFAAWLRRIRPEQAAAHAARERAETETARARAVLAAAHVAERAAEAMLEQQASARLAEAERLAQRDIDEAAQRRGGS